MPLIKSLRMLVFAFALGVGGCVSAEHSRPPEVRNIVLVHGAFVDGSGWQGVYRSLTARGYTVNIVQNPLTSLADDVAAVDRVLARQDGPALLVGHSYGGVVITEIGSSPVVAGLMYVAAYAPDQGESISSLRGDDPPPPFQTSSDGFLFFDPAAFPQAFAQDIDTGVSVFLAASQVPTAQAAFASPVSSVAWRNKPSWFVISTEDRIIPPDMQRRMAARANAAITEIEGSHAIYLSQPEAVADAIDQAARSLVQ
ncbi:alpha/beta hydrolase [Hyphomonas sp. NPDC076900]|uniref:alpha/beta hydrolase n=1 Tax=unclassified Hyphomonas TaxID=2630699 RepID=UPI003D08DF71